MYLLFEQIKFYSIEGIKIMNQTKLRLITAGMEFIQKNGVENLSLREIAKQCGVTHAGPYKHFKNKDDFLKQVSERISLVFGSYLIKNVNISNHDNIKKVLQQMGENFIFFARDYPNFFDILFVNNRWSDNVYINEGKMDSTGSIPGFEHFKKVIYFFKKKYNIKVPETDIILHLWSYILGLSLIISHKDLNGLSEKKLKENIDSFISVYVKES